MWEMRLQSILTWGLTITPLLPLAASWLARCDPCPAATLYRPPWPVKRRGVALASRRPYLAAARKRRSTTAATGRMPPGSRGSVAFL